MLASSSSAAAIIPVLAHALSKALNAILSPLQDIKKLHLLSQEKYPTTQFYNFIKHKFTTTCAPEVSSEWKGASPSEKEEREIADLCSEVDRGLFAVAAL